MGKTTRRKFPPEFKAKVALEALKESSTKGDLAKKYEISPEMISRWKKNSWKMPVRHSERSLIPLISTRSAMPSIEKRRVGDGRGFLQAGIQAVGDTYTRKTLISPTREAVGKDGKRHRYPSRARQSKLLGIARSTSYYKREEGESQRNLKMMDLMDKQYNRCAAMGVRQMRITSKAKDTMSGRNL